MCIIVVVPPKVKAPELLTLEKCFSNNKDGAGLMYVDSKKGMVKIIKGLMTFEAFKAAYTKEMPNIPEESPLVFHFRIGTSGGIVPEKCHPFPITSKTEFLDCLNLYCPVGVAHNGILGKGEDKLSDTQVFIRDVLSSRIIAKNLKSDAVKRLIEFSTNKFAFVFNDMSFHTIGNFEIDSGVYYSNSGFRTFGWRRGGNVTVVGNSRFQNTYNSWDEETGGFYRWDEDYNSYALKETVGGAAGGNGASQNTGTSYGEGGKKKEEGGKEGAAKKEDPIRLFERTNIGEAVAVHNGMVLGSTRLEAEKQGICQNCNTFIMTRGVVSSDGMSTHSMDKVIWTCDSCHHTWVSYIFKSEPFYQKYYSAKEEVNGNAQVGSGGGDFAGADSSGYMVGV